MASPNASPKSDDPIQVADPEAHLPFIARIFGSALFSGYSPIASGTVGSLVALGIYAIPGFDHPPVIITACFLTFILGSKAAEIMERRYGHDPAEVTIDEVLGMWLSVLFLPKTLSVVAAAFLLFRLLDILKPWPAKAFDRSKGGLAIMMDDAIVGFYTNVVLHVLLRAGTFDLIPF